MSWGPFFEWRPFGSSVPELPSQFTYADIFTAQSISLIKAEDRQKSFGRSGNIQIGRRQSFETRVIIDTPPIWHQNVGEIIAFLDDVGMAKPFPVTLPLLGEATGVITSNVTVKTAAIKGSKVIELEGGPNNTTDLVKPNDMLNFESHDKAYWIGVNMTGATIDTFDTDSSGDITIRLSQPLIQDISAGEEVNFLSPTITVIRTDEAVDYSISANDSNFVTVSFEATEFI